jgi:hypothetical protein
MYQNNVVILVARAIDTPHLASLPAVFRSDPSMDDKKNWRTSNVCRTCRQHLGVAENPKKNMKIARKVALSTELYNAGGYI